MSELAVVEAPVWCKRDFHTEIGMGRRAVDLTIFEQQAGAGGLIIPLVPGLAAKRRIGEPLAIELAELGHTPVLIAHEGASEEGVAAVEYVLRSLEQSEFAGQPLPLNVDHDIVPIGHSLGARKTVHALTAMQDTDSRIQGAVLQAAACLGGVRALTAPVNAVRSINHELFYMKHHSFEHYAVAVESLEYVRALGRRVFDELRDASSDSIEEQIRDLQEAGVSFAAVDHSQDALVSTHRNLRAYRRLNIRSYAVQAQFAGHNAHLYHPSEAKDAVLLAIGEVLPPRMPKAA